MNFLEIKIKHTLFLTLCWILLFNTFVNDTFAQGNNCATATSLTVASNSTCSNITGDNETLTNGTYGCTGGTTARFRDGWFSFVAKQTNQDVRVNGAANFRARVGVYTDCSSTTNVTGGTCTSAAGTGDAITLNLTGLTIGTTYYVQVYNHTADAGTQNNRNEYDICVTTPSAPNDACAGSTTLTHQASGSCTTTTGSVAGATTSTPTPTCTGTANFDVWYTFTATSTIAQINVVAAGVNEFVEVFSQTGACTGLTSLGCFTTDGGGTVSGLTNGAVYRVRVGSESATFPSTDPTFTICVTTPSPPANNNCAGAVSLTQQAAGSCATTSGTVLAATQSVAPCTGTGNTDVWYSFQATSTSAVVSRIAGFDSVVEVFSGTCAGVLTSLGSCQDVETDLTITGLTVGVTYFVRIYYFVAGTPTTPTFNICITTPPSTPANDNCVGAISVTHEPFGSCVGTSGTVTNATQSLAGCTGTADDDIWFRFTATSTVADIRVNWSQDEVVQVFSGSCAGLSSVVCQDTPEGSVVTSALTVGQVYFVRVYSSTSITPTYPSFSICITTTSTASNDACAGAVSVIHSPAGTCNLTAGTFNGATSSLADCSGNGYTVRDIWYTFQATAATALIHRVASVNTIVQVFTESSTCGAPTSLSCSSGTSADIQLTGLTVGSNYLVRIYPASSTAPTDPRITVCITTPSTITNPTCATSAPICGSNTLSFQAITGGTAPAGNDYGCLISQPAPAWFYLQVATSGSLVFGLEASADVDYALWGPYNTYADATAACGTLPAPISCSYSIQKTESATISNALVGQVYVLLVTNFANVNQAINLRQIGGTGATSCSIVLASGLKQLTAVASENNNILTWRIAEDAKNTRGFEIHKSTDGRRFQMLTYLDRTDELAYQYTENAMNCQNAYYKLITTQHDGKRVESEVAAVIRKKGDCSHLLEVFPNPAQRRITLLPTISHQDDLEYILSDSKGNLQMAGKVKKENDKYDLEISNLPKGLYILKVKVAQQWVYEKVLKD